VAGASSWVESLADRHAAEPGHGPDCEGSLRHIDAEALLRGVAAVRVGNALSLSRPVRAGQSVRRDEQRATLVLETFARVSAAGHVVGSDRLEVDCHGLANTHLDGFTHTGLDGRWHTGEPAEASATDGTAALLVGSSGGIATRVRCLDATAGGGWVMGPVSGDDLDVALSAAGATILPGDAVVVYMGRDRYEAAGNSYGPIAEHPSGRPGIGRSGAEWLADHHVSVLCWDFLDAHVEGGDVLPVHAVTWAVGLVLVDNCHLGPAVRALQAADTSAGLLVIAPPQLSGATGAIVNPIVLY
jgi:kynurenine formamidase